MTYRDANANDLTDFLDLQALPAGQPTFPELPPLVPAGNDARAARLLEDRTGQGSGAAARAEALRSVGTGQPTAKRGLVVELQTDRGTMTGLEVELFQGRHRVAHQFVASVGYPEHRVIVRVRGRAPKTGHYTLVVRQGSRTLVATPVGVR